MCQGMLHQASMCDENEADGRERSTKGGAVRRMSNTPPHVDAAEFAGNGPCYPLSSYLVNRGTPSCPLFSAQSACPAGSPRVAFMVVGQARAFLSSQVYRSYYHHASALGLELGTGTLALLHLSSPSPHPSLKSWVRAL